MADNPTLAAQVVLMVGVALDELTMAEAEPDLSRVRASLTSVKTTLAELSSMAAEQQKLPPQASNHAKGQDRTPDQEIGQVQQAEDNARNP
jgi:hypothetical protein